MLTATTRETLSRFLNERTAAHARVGVRYPLTVRDFASDIAAIAFMSKKEAPMDSLAGAEED